MYTLSAAVEVDAPAALVWHVVTDFERYPAWSAFVRTIDAELRVGAPVRMSVKLIAGIEMNLVEAVEAVEEGRFLRYGYRKIAPYMNGYRDQTVTPLGPVRCRYETSTTWSGVLTPIARLLYERAVRRGFDETVVALKTRAEALHREARHAA